LDRSYRVSGIFEPNQHLIGNSFQKTSGFFYITVGALEEGLKTGDGATKNQGMNVMCTFVRIDGFQVADMAYDVVFITDAVAAQDVSHTPADVQGLAAGVTLQETDHLGGGSLIILEARHV